MNDILPASWAAVATTAIVHPADTVRTRLQATGSTSISQCISALLSEGGVSAFYKGLSAPLLAQVAYKTTIFSTIGVCHWIVPEISHFACGGAAGAVNSLIVTPVELLRNRLMVSSTSSSALFTLQSVLRERGVRGMWKGLGITFLRDSSGMALWYGMFNYSKEWMMGRYGVSGTDELPLYSRIVCGAIGGVSYWTAALPFDTIKSIVQTQKVEEPLLSTVRRVISEKGVYFLYRAWPIAYARGIPSSAIFLTLFDSSKIFAGVM